MSIPQGTNEPIDDEFETTAVDDLEEDDGGQFEEEPLEEAFEPEDEPIQLTTTSVTPKVTPKKKKDSGMFKWVVILALVGLAAYFLHQHQKNKLKASS
jgi:hypothetical protein